MKIYRIAQTTQTKDNFVSQEMLNVMKIWQEQEENPNPIIKNYPGV